MKICQPVKTSSRGLPDLGLAVEIRHSAFRWIVLAMALAACGCLAHGRTRQSQTLSRLVLAFENETAFWKQLDLAEQIANLRDPAALALLEPSLRSDDGLVRANAAYVFARLGDPRGLDTILGMVPGPSRPRSGRETPEATVFWGEVDPADVGSLSQMEVMQLRQEQYHAVHLLGILKEDRAVDVLLPLLADRGLGYKAIWALGEIGDPRATQPLIQALQDRDPSIRVLAIHALQSLGAVEALPFLRELVDDSGSASFGNRVTVGETARQAIERLESRQP